MRIGAASKDMSPQGSIPLCGQVDVRMSKFQHDPLTANAVYFEEGGKKAAIVSCDLVGMVLPMAAQIHKRCLEQYGLTEQQVHIACTHTHLGPYTYPSTWAPPEVLKQDYLHEIQEKVVAAIGEAIANAEPCEVYAGKGFVEQMGFNRRGVRKDGSADMYYGSWNGDFDRLEGPRDGEVGVIFAHPAGKEFDQIKVVISSFATHPNSMESESFVSADLVASVRRQIKKTFGEQVVVVYLTGAAGNTAPTDLENNREAKMPWRGETGWRRSGYYLGSEIVKTIAGTVEPMKKPKLDNQTRLLKIAVRDWPKDFDWSKIHPAFKPHCENACAHWDEWKKKNPTSDVPVGVIRIGDAAICTNPAELYCEFGLAIKKQSPAEVTLIAELTDGMIGYVPIPAAIRGGGYSAMPEWMSCRHEETAGDKIVQTTLDMLNQIF
jgi:neutral ceramidase